MNGGDATEKLLKIAKGRPIPRSPAPVSVMQSRNEKNYYEEEYISSSIASAIGIVEGCDDDDDDDDDDEYYEAYRSKEHKILQKYHESRRGPSSSSDDSSSSEESSSSEDSSEEYSEESSEESLDPDSPDATKFALRMSGHVEGERKCRRLAKAIKKACGDIVTQVHVGPNKAFKWSPIILQFSCVVEGKEALSVFKKNFNRLVGKPITSDGKENDVVIESITPMKEPKAKKKKKEKKVKPKPKPKGKSSLIQAIRNYQMVDDTVLQIRAAEEEIENYLAQVELDEIAAALRWERIDDEMGGLWRRLFLMADCHLQYQELEAYREARETEEAIKHMSHWAATERVIQKSKRAVWGMPDEALNPEEKRFAEIAKGIPPKFRWIVGVVTKYSITKTEKADLLDHYAKTFSFPAADRSIMPHELVNDNAQNGAAGGARHRYSFLD